MAGVGNGCTALLLQVWAPHSPTPLPHLQRPIDLPSLWLQAATWVRDPELLEDFRRFCIVWPYAIKRVRPSEGIEGSHNLIQGHPNFIKGSHDFMRHLTSKRLQWPKAASRRVRYR